MNTAALAAGLRKQFPYASSVLNQIVRLDAIASNMPFEPFYEPVSLIVKDGKGEGRHMNIDAPMLHAWAKHMAYSMRTRLRVIEPSILRELQNESTLGASILLRAHLEAAAMAALCMQTLADARDSEKLDALGALMSKTLFGTALANKAKKDERVLDMLTFAEQQTITVTSAIDALDSFTYGDSANGATSILYALLCESSHPNMRGTSIFTSHREVEPEGWEIKYAAKETLSSESVAGILNGLVRSMRGGYAAAEMLRIAEFTDGSRPYRGISPSHGARIWKALFDVDA